MYPPSLTGLAPILMVVLVYSYIKFLAMQHYLKHRRSLKNCEELNST
jgi:hypothetical protein